MEKRIEVEAHLSAKPSLQERYKELQGNVNSLVQGDAFNVWLRQQAAPVEVAVTTLLSAVQGAALGGLMGVLGGDVQKAFPSQSPGVNPQALSAFQQAQALTGGPWVQARNFAVMTGVNSGISCAMKRARGGVEDIQTSMVAAFGSGAMFSLISGAGGQNIASNAVMTGAFFAVIQGGMFKLGKLAQPPPDDMYYVNGRSMLRNLGLERYQKNFKKGLLADSTLSLLNDSALREVNIPPGPRLLILDFIKRANMRIVQAYHSLGTPKQADPSCIKLVDDPNMEEDEHIRDEQEEILRMLHRELEEVDRRVTRSRACAYSIPVLTPAEAAESARRKSICKGKLPFRTPRRRANEAVRLIHFEEEEEEDPGAAMQATDLVMVDPEFDDEGNVMAHGDMLSSASSSSSSDHEFY